MFRVNMEKRYFIYWWASEKLSGNSILSFDFKKNTLTDLIQLMIKELNEDKEGKGIKNFTIKFITEIK